MGFLKFHVHFPEETAARRNAASASISLDGILAWHQRNFQLQETPLPTLDKGLSHLSRHDPPEMAPKMLLEDQPVADELFLYYDTLYFFCFSSFKARVLLTSVPHKLSLLLARVLIGKGRTRNVRHKLYCSIAW